MPLPDLNPPAASTEASGPTPPPYACSHCSDCGYNNFPPADVCPNCWSSTPQLQELSHEGVLYSFSTLVGRDSSQFVGYVDLPEKIRVFGLLTTTDRPECGTPVSFAEARPVGNGPCFVFDVSTTQEA